MASSEGSVAEGSKLKSAQLLDLVKAHLATDAGKDLQQKIGYTYQINIAPKVALALPFLSISFLFLFFLFSSHSCLTSEIRAGSRSGEEGLPVIVVDLMGFGLGGRFLFSQNLDFILFFAQMKRSCTTYGDF
jgi:hypothetical protein